MSELEHEYYVQHGSTPDLKVTDERKFYVVEETWEGNRRLNMRIVGVADSWRDAVILRDQKQRG